MQLTGTQFGELVHGFATRKPDGSVQIVVYHFDERNQQCLGNPVLVNLAVQGRSDMKEVQMTHYRIDQEHSNAVAAWVALGSPPNHTPAQKEQIKAGSELQTLGPPKAVAVEGRQVNLSFELPVNAVSLIVLEAKSKEFMIGGKAVTRIFKTLGIGLVLLAVALGGCSLLPLSEEATAHGQWTSPAEASATVGSSGALPLIYSVMTPLPPEDLKAENAALLTEALKTINTALPAATMVHLMFENRTSSVSDWIAVLNAVHSQGFRAVVAFGARDSRGLYQAFRPVYANGRWQFESLGEFVSCAACITHPALYAIGTLDEPWHYQKQPRYPTEQLKDMYRQLKALAPAGSDFKVMVQFSRELWVELVENRNPQLYWDRGICDVVQISALEFQDGEYQFDLLDQNHYWSRKIIHEKTPEIPLWTSVQVMGSRYGPGPGYWFPRERDGHHDLLRLLNDLTAEKYQREHPLTGLMFQTWDSPQKERRAQHFTLGDQHLQNQPPEQVTASQDAIRAINEWVQSRRSNAIIAINATQPGAVIDGSLWGSNLPQNTGAGDTVGDPGFVAAARQMGIRLVRWPGGNNADLYDWKRDEYIEPGRRSQDPNWINFPAILDFTRQIGAELTVTVNFGAMTAADAADLVQFLNGPANSEWGSVRARWGYPEPLNVRFFEIGNEENQCHMWYFSWTAENPYKYFFGGEEERRGFYDRGGGCRPPADPLGAKGDFFEIGGGPNQQYRLRFPPVRNVRVFWAASVDDARNGALREWQQVEDLSAQPANAKVFELDGPAGIIRFGDGAHGAIPPRGYFLVEYTTYDHKGFVEFARAMRAASPVPIQIGAATLPFIKKNPIGSPEQMREIFEAMDFHVAHQYNAGFPYDTYAQRRQIAFARVPSGELLRQYLDSIRVSKPIGVGITEWNIFLDERYWQINRTLEGAVIAAEWMIRLLNAQAQDPPLDVRNAAQFALHDWSLALSLISKNNGSIAPMGYVFEGFRDWPSARLLPVSVVSPEELAYDRKLPIVQAAAALSADGNTLLVALVNNSESITVSSAFSIKGFRPDQVRVRRLSAPSYKANNDRDPATVVLSDEVMSSALGTLVLRPHSVTFLELRIIR